MFSSNCCSIVNKIPAFNNYVNSNDYVCFCLTETKLDTSISNSVFGLPKFDVFRNDRTRHGGGAAIFTATFLKCISVPIVLDRVVPYDIVAIDIIARGGSKSRLLCVYRPPSCNVEDTRHLLGVLSVLVSSCDSFIICGDFNFPGMGWDPPMSNSAISEDFLELIEGNGMTQFVLCPTHRDGNILDLVLGSDEYLVSDLTVDPPLFIDHFCVVFHVNFKVSPSKKWKYVKQYGNSQDMFAFLSHIDWDIVFDTLQTADDVWGEFKNVVLFAIDTQVPEKKIACGNKHLFDLQTDTEQAKCEKKRVYDIWRLHKTVLWKYLLGFWTKKVHNLVARDRAIQENHICQANDTSKFFSYVKRVLKRESSMPELEDHTGVTHRDDKSKADCLNRFFCSVFTVNNGVVPRFVARTNVELRGIRFTADMVRKALMKLSSSYSSGVDDIPSIVLKKCAEPLVEPLCTLFNVCFETERIPMDWLCANVTPIYKGSGSSKSPNNYRPVSLTSVSCKVMESCVKDVVLKHLLENSLLTWHQHGFLPKRSTLTELLECLNYWMEAINRGEHVDVMYIDLRKAFDSVDHKKLIQKCEAYGIRGKSIAFIKAFLTNRWQRVKVGDVFSQWSRVTSGVPQGSVLGPLLFLIYINDMPDVISSCEIKLYADDAKIFRSRESTMSRAVGLQHDLTSLQIWCEEWQMQINGSKCSLLQIGWNRNVVTQYTVGGVVAPNETSVKDLGVSVSGRLNFSEHCGRISSKASQRVGLTYRAFSSRDTPFMIGMFKTYVRPILEYNCEVWSPVKLEDIDRLERVQRSFTKRIKGLFNKTYSERLLLCGIESLEFRRIKRDVVLVYKIINGLIDLLFIDYFDYAPDVGTRGNSLKLYARHARTNITLNFFGNRVVNFWNVLPNYVVLAPSLNVFKKRLDEKADVLRQFLRGRAFRNP